MRSRGLLESQADSPKPASPEVASQELAYLRSSLGLGREWSVGRLAIDFLKAALRPGALRGAACLDVLKGSGARVSLPVAHYSDSSPRSW